MDRILIRNFFVASLCFLSACSSQPKLGPQFIEMKKMQSTVKMPSKDPVEVRAQQMFQNETARKPEVGVYLLKDWMEKRDIAVIDLNPENYRIKYGVIKGAIWIHEFGTHESEIFEACLGRAACVLYGHQDNLTLQEAYFAKAKSYGVEQVYLLAGGIESWVRMQDKVKQP